MRTMTKRSVARQAPELWALVDAGETVYVLDNGRPAYRVEAVAGPVDPIDDLLRRGLMVPAVDTAEPFVPAAVEPAVAAAIVADFEADRDSDER